MSPSTGSIPRAAREVQDRLKQAAAAGKTIFMSTHLLDMAEKVCTRVGIIHRGELVATGITRGAARARRSERLARRGVSQGHRRKRRAGFRAVNQAAGRAGAAPLLHSTFLLIRLRLRRLAQSAHRGVAGEEGPWRQDAHGQCGQEEQQGHSLPGLAADDVRIRSLSRRAQCRTCITRSTPRIPSG